MTDAVPQYEVSTKKLMSFLRDSKIVTESARSTIVPSMVRFIVGRDFSGNWWSLPQSSRIFNVLQKIREHPDVHVCRLVQRRICFVHRMVWAPLLVLRDLLPQGVLDRIVETHEDTGTHTLSTIPAPEWVPRDVKDEADSLTIEQATSRLVTLVPNFEVIMKSLKLPITL